MAQVYSMISIRSYHYTLQLATGDSQPMTETFICLLKTGTGVRQIPKREHIGTDIILISQPEPLIPRWLKKTTLWSESDILKY